LELFESLFNISYLILVIALGLRLLFEDAKNARLFGLMAIVLGAGDSFHLLPRIMAHFTTNGFEKYSAALSWGQFVTSITMTVFYVLFYVYYKKISGKSSKFRDLLIIGLALARVVLVLMPQNGWGELPGNYTFSLLRNIPFTIMGALLIIWTWGEGSNTELRKSPILILLSFLFYLPVVLWADAIPILGLLMLPKTVAYLLLVVFGFRSFVKSFAPVNILKDALVFLVMGLAGGVFYREFTRLNDFSGVTTLRVVHVHSIAIGFLALLILWLALKNADHPQLDQKYKKPVFALIGGLYFTIVTMLLRGISQVIGNGYLPFPSAALSGLAGIGHLILGHILVIIFVRLVKSEMSVEKAY